MHWQYRARIQVFALTQGHPVGSIVICLLKEVRARPVFAIGRQQFLLAGLKKTVFSRSKECSSAYLQVMTLMLGRVVTSKTAKDGHC